MSARECPGSLFIREKRVPKQVLSTRSAPPPALGVRAPSSSSPPRVRPQPLNAGASASDAAGAGRVRRGAVGSACPRPATLSLRLHRPQAAPARVGNSVSPTPSHPHPVNANPPGSRRERVTGQGPGAKTADAYGARRLEARCSPPAAARSSRLLLLPRRLPHRATEARGRRKPEEGGPGQGRRGHDSFPTDQAEEPRKARRGAAPPGVRRARHPDAPGTPCAALRARVRILGDCAERLRSSGEAPPARLLAPDAR